MECKAVGTLAGDQLDDMQERLVGLSGLPGKEVNLHELVMRSCIADRPELHLQHSTPGANGGPPGAGSWTATQYRLPLEGRASAELPATVRSVACTACSGPDVLAFWRALGFVVQYQMLKRGLAFEVEHAGHTIQVLLCQVLRLLPEGQQPQEAAGEELVPGYWLVEATAPVEGGAYAEAAAALASLSKLLSPYTVLQPMPRGRLRPPP